jgi:hypothetical protein
MTIAMVIATMFYPLKRKMLGFGISNWQLTILSMSAVNSAFLRTSWTPGFCFNVHLLTGI